MSVLTTESCGTYVTISDRGDGYDGPPQRDRDTREICMWIEVGLHVVHYTGTEDDDYDETREQHLEVF